ncbi:DUF4253 domain-containing protein [Acidovorax sp.]|uniref:DUF4253 domain-containing protein n=1 Tax=Acidovorax sp. TaxID=1872122 RepID=UPI002ACE016A|nr:DUF4253 domain-containing protein [Acidovorax sp.]MDZ7862792.1 DUF4253 domain-containing protein [Acidovorax sp.]
MSPLTTQHLHEQRLDSALDELLANARLAAVAGHASEALAALGLLLQREGAWRLPAHGSLVTQVQRLLPLVALLAGQGCPAVGDQEAMDTAQLPDWAGQQAGQLLQSLALPGRLQLAPVGEGWSADFLAALAHRQGAGGDPRPHLAFGAFCLDAELVLKARIAAQWGASFALGDDVPTADDLIALGLPEDEVAAMLAQLQSAGHIDVAPAAEATDALAIARAMAGYLRATGFAGGYLVHNIWQASWLLLAAEGRDGDATEVAAAWLAHDAPAAATGLLDLAVVPAAANLLRAGHLEPAVGVDAQAVSAWRAALATRAASAPAPEQPAAVPPATPTESREAWLARLQGTPLAALDWLALPVPGHAGAASGEIAWAAQVPVPEREALWQVARALVEQGSGRWPLVTTLWSGSTEAPEPEALADDLFMRFPYEQGAARDDVSPRSLIATARGIGADDVLAELAESSYPLDEKDQLDVWRGELAAAGVPGEACAGFDAAWAECAGDRLRFEHWLAALEKAQGAADPERGRQERFDPDNAWLVLLPTPHSEETLAYLHWYGMERGRADGFIALLRRWREQHGAELWAHYGTMLEFTVRQPPQDFDSALALAREHDLAAPCTLMLPGIALRHHALGLVDCGTWFLHERP